MWRKAFTPTTFGDSKRVTWPVLGKFWWKTWNWTFSEWVCDERIFGLMRNGVAAQPLLLSIFFFLAVVARSVTFFHGILFFVSSRERNLDEDGSWIDRLRFISCFTFCAPHPTHQPTLSFHSFAKCFSFPFHLGNWTIFLPSAAIIRIFRGNAARDFQLYFPHRQKASGWKNSDKKSGHELFFSYFFHFCSWSRALPHPDKRPLPPMRLSIREIGNYWFRVLVFFFGAVYGDGDMDHLGIHQTIKRDERK